jgi:hypothetical protein
MSTGRAVILVVIYVHSMNSYTSGNLSTGCTVILLVMYVNRMNSDTSGNVCQQDEQ